MRRARESTHPPARPQGRERTKGSRAKPGTMKAVRTLQNSSPHAATNKVDKIRYFVQLALHKQARPLRSHRTRVPACGNKIRILSRCAAARVPPFCNRAAYATLAACYNSAPLRGSRSNERSKGRKAPIIKHIPRFQLLSKNLLDKRGNVCYHRHCTRGSFFAVSAMGWQPAL